MSTLFAVAYAARLFREVDNPSSFCQLLHLTASVINLENPAHTTALLNCLKQCGCRMSFN
jgi:hypothetical protein